MDEAWLATVRLARDIGNISSLFPPGITRLIDLPYTIHNAIISAIGFLSFEELPKDERPPRSIWMDGDALAAHWREVERAREAKYGSGAAPAADYSEMDESPLKNELLVGF